MKKCPRCKILKRQDEWTKNQYSHSTYCRECQKYYNSKKSSRIKDIILKATNNSKCWWVYQSILADLSFHKKK